MAKLTLTQFDGTWVFNRELSRLNSQPPDRWVQQVTVTGNSLRIREEIERGGAITSVEIDAEVDGTFYPVTGTVIADEIAYQLGDSLEGKGRLEGAPSFREVLSIDADGALIMELHFQAGTLEVPLGTAHFTRQNQGV